MADRLDLPAYWTGHRARVVGTRHRVRLTCDPLESRDATGNLVGGVVAAAFGAPLEDSLGDLARLMGDWAFLDGAIRTSQPAGRIAQLADEPPRTLTRYDTWLDPQLLFPEERAERGVRVTAPTAPADPGRSAFGDLPGEQPQLTGPIDFGPIPSFVGVRVAPVSASDLPPARGGNTTAAPFPTMAPATSGENLPGVTGPSVMAASTMDEPSNAAPVAANDSATVAEDGYVVIDLMANDSDPDNDGLAIDTWQYAPPNGTVTQETDGRLRYTPFPDFHGTDQFTYKVTDGRLTATGTVTITVTSANDAPVAFDDAYTGGSSVSPLPPAPPDPTVIRIPVLDNDVDYDGSVLTVGGLAASGQVAISADKLAVEWTVPLHYSGSMEFEYQARDAAGALSGWATAKVWAYPVGPAPKPPPPPVVANADGFAVGDGPVVASVRANDTGGAFAVLKSHPTGTRVSRFEFDGVVELNPTLARADAVFEYVLFGADGKGQSTGAVSLWNIGLAIYDGQGGTEIRGPEESKVGAVTVANMNDTDSDGRIDYSDDAVRADPANNATGVDEVDLMKVVVKRPITLIPGETVTVVATHAGADRYPMWYSSSIPTTATLLSTTSTLTLSYSSFIDGYATVWLEARDKSRAVRDLTVEYTFMGATDTVKATAVWSEMTKFHGTGKEARMPPQNGLDREDVTIYHSIISVAFFSGGRNGALGTGTLPYVYDGKTSHTNGVEIEFTLYPAGVATEPRVRWDVSRSAEYFPRYWDAVAGKWAQVPETQDVHFPPNRDEANDDPGPPSQDEISKPINNGDKLYQMDHPGVNLEPAYLAAWTDFFQQLNGLEFVRVKFDGANFASVATPTVQGSRASHLYAWHSWLYYQKTNGVWDRPRDAGGLILTAYNELDQGVKAFNPDLSRP